MKRASPQGEGDHAATEAEENKEQSDRNAIKVSTDRNSEKVNAQENNGNYPRSLVRQSRIQIATNCLIALFTLVLALVGYSTQMPYVAARARAVAQFVTGQPIKLSIALENLGQTPAYKATVSVGMAILPYPLNVTLPSDPPAASNVPLTLYLREPTGMPLTSEILQRKDADAVTQGAKNLFYVWGKIRYKDVFGLPHSSDFCFAYGGAAMDMSAGICTVNQGQQYVLETQPQPHAQPNRIPLTSTPSEPPFL